VEFTGIHPDVNQVLQLHFLCGEVSATKKFDDYYMLKILAGLFKKNVMFCLVYFKLARCNDILV